MQTEYQTLWNKCLAVIKDIVPEAAFNTWFKPIIPLSYEDNKFTIQVPSQFFYEYLEEKYVNVLKVTLYRVIGQGTILNYRIKVVDKVKEDGMITLPTGNDAPRTGKKSADIPSLFESKARQDWDSHLNPKYNFDNYFEGTSNRLSVLRARLSHRNRGRPLTRCLYSGRPVWERPTYAMRSVTAFRRSIRKRRCCIYQPTFLPYNTRKPSGKIRQMISCIFIKAWMC